MKKVIDFINNTTSKLGLQKKIGHYDVNNLLYADGWTNEANYSARFRDYYRFEKEFYDTAHCRIDYELTTVTGTTATNKNRYVLIRRIRKDVLILKTYKKIPSQSEVVEAIALVNAYFKEWDLAIKTRILNNGRTILFLLTEQPREFNELYKAARQHINDGYYFFEAFKYLMEQKIILKGEDDKYSIPSV